MSTLPTTLTEGDSAEWLLIAAYGGIPHPSGYPLHALLCRLAYFFFKHHLPLLPLLTLLTTLLTSIALAYTFLALKQLNFNNFIAGSAALLTFTTSIVWRMSNLPEPFALNLLLAAALCYLSAKTCRHQVLGLPLTPATLISGGLVFGLGFCNHHSLVTLYPLGLYLLYRSFKEEQQRTKSLNALRRVSLRFTLGFSCGLLPLLYFFKAKNEPSPFNFRPLQNYQDLLALVLRKAYGTFKLAATDTPLNSETLRYYFKQLPSWWSYGLLIAIISGIGYLLYQAKAPKLSKFLLSKSYLLALSLSFIQASLGFFRLFNISLATGYSLTISERFMALPTFLLYLPLAVGLKLLSDLLGKKTLWLPSLALCFLLHLGLQRPRANRAQETFYEHHVHNVFKLVQELTPVLVNSSDSEILGTLYGQHILKLAPPSFLWLNATHLSKRVKLGQLLQQELLPRYKRVIVMDKPRGRLPQLFKNSYVIGPATILVADQSAKPAPLEIFKQNQRFYNEFQQRLSQKQPKLTALDQTLLSKYTQNLKELETVFTAATYPQEFLEIRKWLAQLTSLHPRPLN